MKNIPFEKLSQNGIVKFEITANDLMKVVKDVVQETTDAILMSVQNDESTDFIPRKEAMSILNVKTTNTMMNWEEKGYLKPHRIGSRIFYKRNEVIEAFENFKRAELSSCA